MRRIFAILVVIVLLALPVYAANQVTTAGCYATVTSDGNCQVNLVATMHLDAPQEDLQVYLPKGATDVTLNGSRVATSRSGQTRVIKLDNVMGSVAGDFSLNIHYSLTDTVSKNEEDILVLTLPLLSGFDFGITSMEFSVTLPGEITTEPAFSSGYHQADIEKDLTYVISGNTISGKCSKALKDHETLTITMPVTEKMFPQPVVQVESTDVGVAGMIISAALALLYWLIFLRNMPVRRRNSTQPPQGSTAGQLGAILHGRGVNLTFMVLTWAELGYILIHKDRPDRVLLYKQMDMGNERSETERRLFNKLFGKRQTVNAAGEAYAQLAIQAEQKPAQLREMIKPGSGNPKVFRVLVSGIGLFGGVCIALALGSGAALLSLLTCILAIAGGISGWFMQLWLGDLRLHGKQNLLITAIGGGAWLLLSLLGGRVDLGLWMLVGLLVGGVMLECGGRRTEYGRYTKAQVLGLRHYLKTVSIKDLQRISAQNPEYYHTLAPYALALDVGKQFAGGFGKLRLPPCPYLVSDTEAHLTAMQYYERLDGVVRLMEAKKNRRFLDKLLRLIGK